MNTGPISGELIQQHYNIDPQTWADMTPAERALFRMAFAADVWHVQEEPAGTNSGPEVDRMLQAAGVDSGNPWCASAWTCYLMDSGISRHNLPPRAASVHGWGDWAEANGLAKEEPGRAFAGLIYHDAVHGHLVAIASVEGDMVNTIEGNSNEKGSSDGEIVCRNTRPISSFHCFVDCTALTA